MATGPILARSRRSEIVIARAAKARISSGLNESACGISARSNSAGRIASSAFFGDPSSHHNPRALASFAAKVVRHEAGRARTMCTRSFLPSVGSRSQPASGSTAGQAPLLADRIADGRDVSIHHRVLGPVAAVVDGVPNQAGQERARARLSAPCCTRSRAERPEMTKLRARMACCHPPQNSVGSPAARTSSGGIGSTVLRACDAPPPAFRHRPRPSPHRRGRDG